MRMQEKGAQCLTFLLSFCIQLLNSIIIIIIHGIEDNVKTNYLLLFQRFANGDS